MIERIFKQNINLLITDYHEKELICQYHRRIRSDACL